MKSPLDLAIMAGKVCLVTGATSGIGRATAALLAGRGAEVVIAGRDRGRAEETASWIASEAGSKTVPYLLADFSDLRQVRDLATAVRGMTSHLDVLVNNAGAFFNRRRQAPNGLEMTFLVNHLSPFLLTNLLLDTLQASESARIVNVSSDAHRYARLDVGGLELGRAYSGFKAYARSKLANVLFTYELARRLDGSQITVNAVHPGHVASDMYKTSFPLMGPALKWMMGLFALSPEQGADSVGYLASSPEIEGISGRYFDRREPVQSSAHSQDRDVAQRLWEISEKLTALRTPDEPV